MTRGQKTRNVLGAAVAAVMLTAVPAGAQVTPPLTNGFVFDGVVASTLKLGSFTYVGGDFDAQVRPITGNAVVAAATGTGPLIAGGAPPITGGKVDVTVDDGAGGLYVGGSFTAVGSAQRRNLAHIKADGTVDAAWNPSADGPIEAIDRVGTRVFVLGAFGTVGGRSFGASAAGRVAALDAVTGKATAFTPAVSGVEGIDAAGGLVYVAGSYAGGPARALDAATGQSTAWRPAESASQAVRVMVSGTRVVLAVPDPGAEYDVALAAFDSTTGANLWRAAGSNIGREGIVAAGGRIYFTVAYPRADTQTGWLPLALRAIDAATGERVWSTTDGLGSPTQSAICGVFVSGSAVYVTGRFRRLQDGGADRHGAAAFDATTGAPLPWDPYLNGTTCGIGALGGGIYLSGTFTAGGTPVARVHNLARVRADGTIDASFSPGALRRDVGIFDEPFNVISSMRPGGSKLYVAGGFASFGGLPRSSLAAVDLPTGTVDQAFAPEGASPELRITDVYPDRVRVRDEYSASEFTRATGARIPRRTTLENDLETMLERLDPTAGASIRGVLSPTPYPGGGVGIVLRVGDVIVGSGVATVPGESDVEVPVALNDVGRLILSVYPRFVFGGVAVYAFADGEEPVWAQAQVQAPAG